MPLSDPASQPPKFVRPLILGLLAVAMGLVLIFVVRRPPHPTPTPTPTSTPASNSTPTPIPSPSHSPSTSPSGFTLAPSTTPSSPAIQPVTYLDANLGPITFYLDKCASCHGAYGSYYYENDILAEERGRIHHEGLLSQVRLMGETNAHVTLTDPQAKALAAYVSTFPDVADTDAAVDGPFLAITGWSPDNRVLSGEVTPDSTVAIEIPGVATPGSANLTATVTGHQWTLTLDPAIDPTQVVIIATHGDKQARLHLNQGSFAIPQ